MIWYYTGNLSCTQNGVSASLYIIGLKGKSHKLRQLPCLLYVLNSFLQILSKSVEKKEVTVIQIHSETDMMSLRCHNHRESVHIEFYLYGCNKM